MAARDRPIEQQRDRQQREPERHRHERPAERGDGVDPEIERHVLVVRVRDRPPPDRQRDPREHDRGRGQRDERDRETGDRVDDEPSRLLPRLRVGGHRLEQIEEPGLAGSPIDDRDRVAAEPAGKSAIGQCRPAEHVHGADPHKRTDDEHEQADGHRQAGHPDDETDDAHRERAEQVDEIAPDRVERRADAGGGWSGRGEDGHSLGVGGRHDDHDRSCGILVQYGPRVCRYSCYPYHVGRASWSGCRALTECDLRGRGRSGGFGCSGGSGGVLAHRAHRGSESGAGQAGDHHE